MTYARRNAKSDRVRHVRFVYKALITVANSSLVITAACKWKVDMMMLILQSFVIIVTVSSGLANPPPLDKIRGVPPCESDKVRNI